MRRPWNDVVIADCGESLASLKTHFLCLEPHPYARAGAPTAMAPIPTGFDPALARLQRAQDQLSLAQDPLQDLCSWPFLTPGDRCRCRPTWCSMRRQSFASSGASIPKIRPRAKRSPWFSVTSVVSGHRRVVILECPPRIALAQQWISPLLIPPGRCWRWGVRLMPSVRSRSPMFMHQQQTRIRPVMLRFGMEGDASCMT